MFRQFLGRLSRATPARCEICRAWPAEPVCQACRLQFAAPRHRCSQCALAIPPGIDRCGRCLHSPPPIDHCHAAVSYGYPWAALVTGFKFAGQAGWADSFAALLSSVPGVQHATEGARWLVPMPLSRERLAERGFNQAHELARRLSPRRAEAGLAIRLRDTPPQARLDRAARLDNLRQAFAIEPRRAHEVRGQSVLLVDDVMTSGASLFSLAQAFRQAGAAQVGAVVFARTEDS